MSSFLNYANKKDKEIYNMLKGKSIGSTAFDNAWKAIAKKYPDRFNELQHNFIKGSHYSPAVNKIKSLGVNIDSRSLAVQNVIWSIGTQHGAGGAYNIAKAAGITSKMSDKEIIQRLYAERMKVTKYFSRSSKAVQQGVLNRFKRELADALAMLAKQGTKQGGSQEA